MTMIGQLLIRDGAEPVFHLETYRDILVVSCAQALLPVADRGFSPQCSLRILPHAKLPVKVAREAKHHFKSKHPHSLFKYIRRLMVDGLLKKALNHIVTSLESGSSYLTKPDSVGRTHATEDRPNILFELDAIRRLEAFTTRREHEELREEQNRQEAEFHGTLRECGCCFSDEPMNRMVSCNVNATHASLQTCLSAL
jgi:hypothetical protein